MSKEIIELVRRSGDRAVFPDNIYGYGIPDLWKAYQSTKMHRQLLIKKILRYTRNLLILFFTSTLLTVIIYRFMPVYITQGDFSEGEVEKAIEQGFTPISLGKSRLRTETAALVACHTLNLLNLMQLSTA